MSALAAIGKAEVIDSKNNYSCNDDFYSIKNYFTTLRK